MNVAGALIAVAGSMAIAAVALNRLGVALLKRRARRAVARDGSFAGGHAIRLTPDLITPDLITPDLITPDLITLVPNGRPTVTAAAVLLVHAWGVPDPAAYRGLIEHLLERGHIVRFPLYQRSFTPHAIAPRLRAILDRDAPDWRQDTALAIGHSAGAAGLLDLIVAEHAGIAVRDVFLASPGDGSGPDGQPARTSWALLKWGQAPPPSARSPAPTITVISSDGDALTGHATADRMADYLQAIGWGDSTSRVRLPASEGCRTHFWPLGGDPAYRLSPMTQAFAKTDALGGATDWRCDAVDRAFWQMIDDAARRDAARLIRCGEE